MFSAVEKSLVCVCDRYRTVILFILQFTVLGVGISFFIFAIHSISLCYVSPCDFTKSDSMFKIDSGLSVEMITWGSIYLLQPLSVIFGLYRKLDPMTGGVVIGITIMTGIAALVDSVVWGTKATMITDMSGDYIHGTEDMIPNTAAKSKLTMISTLASAIFALEVLTLSLIAYAPDSIVMVLEPRRSLSSSIGGASLRQEKALSKGHHYNTNETQRLMNDGEPLDDGDENPFQDDVNELTI